MQLPTRQKSPDTTSPASSDGKFLSRWAKRGLRDQAGIYTAPFHLSELGWVMGCQCHSRTDRYRQACFGRIIEKTGINASTDITDVGLFATAGAVGVLLLDGVNPWRFTCS